MTRLTRQWRKILRRHWHRTEEEEDMTLSAHALASSRLGVITHHYDRSISNECVCAWNSWQYRVIVIRTRTASPYLVTEEHLTIARCLKAKKCAAYEGRDRKDNWWGWLMILWVSADDNSLLSIYSHSDLQHHRSMGWMSTSRNVLGIVVHTSLSLSLAIQGDAAVSRVASKLMLLFFFQ